MNELFQEKIKVISGRLRKIKNKELIIGFIVILAVVLLYSTIGNVSTKSASSVNIEFSETEKKLEKTLSQIKGVGKVNVMITYRNEENVVKATDSIFGGNKNEISTTEKCVNGVIVVAEGGSQNQIKIEIIKATMTVLDINANQIQVFAMK